MGSYPPSRAYKGWAMYTVYKHTTPSGKVYIGITGKHLVDTIGNMLKSRGDYD